MKVLIDHSDPFLLAHGGFQIQIEQTRLALLECGLDVEFLRWWDPQQTGDIIHFFGRPFPTYIDLAHQKGLKVVFSALHGATGSRKRWQLQAQKTANRLAESLIPNQLLQRLAWKSYRTADACVVLTSLESQLVQELFLAPPEKIHIVPNGVELVFTRPAANAQRDKWLVTTATIDPRKRVVETAEAAIEAQIPYWVIGKPFADSEPYYRRWIELCHAYPQWLRYEGAIKDRSKLANAYQQARGFALLSDAETLSISALEAAACGCPLLLSDLPWARSAFGEAATYCPLANARSTARCLRAFYDQAPTLPIPPRPKDWRAVAQQLKGIYESVCNNSR